MSILTTYTLTYLRLNRKRTAVTILGVLLSSALICGVLLLGASFQQVMIDHEIFMAGNWHAQLHAVPAAKAGAVAQHRAVQAAMLSRPLGSASYGSHSAVRPYLYVAAYDTPMFKHQPIRLVAGRFPEKDDELLVSPVMIADSGLGLRPGSTVHLSFGQRNIPDYDTMVKAWGGEEYVALADGETFTTAATKTYTVVGLMAPLADETSMPAAFPAFTYLDQTQLVASDRVDIAILARDPRGVNVSAPEIAKDVGLAVRSGPDGQPLRESIAYNEDLLPWLGGSGHAEYVRFFLATLAILIALIVGGSALVIYNAFAISIGERKRQFGMFSSVGATSAQIRRIVLAEAGVIAAVGIPLGILSAIAGAAILLRLTQGLVAELILDAEEGLPLLVSPQILILTAAFAAATTLLSAWWPARRAARVSPIDAIRQSGEIQDAGPRRLRASPLIRRVFGFEGELALKSLRRDRKKYLTTLLSLMISIILFVSFNSLMLYTSTTASMAAQAMNFDLMIDLDYRESHANRFAELVGQLPEVQRAAYRRSTYEQYLPARATITEPAHQALRELHGLAFENLPEAVDGGTYKFVLEVSAVGPGEFAHYAAQLGLDPQQYADPSVPTGILINHTSLRQGGKMYDFDLFNLKPGDTITATNIAGSPESLSWKIGAVTRETPLGFMGVTLVPELIVSDATFDGLRDRLLELGPINLGHMVIQSDSPDAALAAIERLYQATIGGKFSYQSMKDFNRGQSLRTLLTSLFFYGFLALITLIGVMNIINTLDTNIKLRRREIAMLRSAGLTPGGLRGMLRYESLFYGLTALLYGLPLGIALSALIYYQFDGVSAFAFTLPWGAIAACIVGTLAIVFVTMMISGAMIRNDTIADAIKQENV